MKGVAFRNVYKILLRHFGPQSWWPGETAFEVCVGAILTQNTAWRNVEMAIRNLKSSRLLAPRALGRVSNSALARHLRPTGYFNLKARRIKAFVQFFYSEYRYSFARMGQELYIEELRNKLLEVHGIGRETADSILLYALEKPIFVVDAYTRRIFSRHEWIRGNEDYDDIRLRVEKSWANFPRKQRLRDFNEFHALLVATGKDFCRRHQPRCSECPLLKLLPANSRLFRCARSSTTS